VIRGWKPGDRGQGTRDKGQGTNKSALYMYPFYGLIILFNWTTMYIMNIFMHSIPKLGPVSFQVTGYKLQVPLGRISVGILKFFKTIKN
jgi:hypothetical protein